MERKNVLQNLCFYTFYTIAAVSLASCTTAEFIQHTPTLANSGHHTGKGEFTGRAMYSSGGSTVNGHSSRQEETPYENMNGLQAQGSYSITKNVAVQGSFMYSAEQGGSTKNGNRNIIYNYKRNIAEAGLAWFAPVNNKETFYFEMAGGAGIGKYKSTEAASQSAQGGRFYNNNVTEFFIQPSFYSVTENGNFYGAAGVKIANINFNNIATNYSITEKESREITTTGKLNTQTFGVFTRLEVFTNKLPWLGVSLQGMFTHDMGQRFNLNFNDSNGGIGLCIRPGRKSKK